MNTPVSFKLAKLLKEKSFNLPVHQYYQFIRDLSSKKDKTWQLINSSFLVRESDASMFPDEGRNGVEVAAYSDRLYRDFNFKTSIDFISAPTIAEVVCWIYSKYQIWIQVSILKDDEWHYSIRRKDNNWNIEFPTKEKCISIENAYEKGINVVLNTYKPKS